MDAVLPFSRKGTTLKTYSVALQEYLGFLVGRSVSDARYALNADTRECLKRLAEYQVK